ncbi:hypothetical protein N9B72_01370, partial [Bacteriovoracaceae bacterium]|nr:hypothetical protein [Bacteriovoracaceae bacterium]
QGLQLYDMEYFATQNLLRLFIMNEETKSAVIEDCSKVDRAFDPYFETQEWLPEISLEVSSPGMFRRLKSLEHFEAVVGERICITLLEKFSPEKYPDFSKKIYKEKRFKGVLASIATEGIEFNLENKNILIKFNNIKKANLEPDV